MYISIRQTQKGDWLVFRAEPAQMGIGIKKVGSSAGGYTTSTQYSRHKTEIEAKKAAKTIAAKYNAKIIEWQPPQGKNQRFIDLPRLYPTEKTFENCDEATEAGWIHINPDKRIEYYRGQRIYCVDVTPGNSFGYNLAIKCNGQTLLESSEIRCGRFFSVRFRVDDIVDAILEARKWIDQILGDLITQSEAALLMSEISDNKATAQTIHNAIYRDNRLKGYPDPFNENNPAMVSEKEVRELWG